MADITVIVPFYKVPYEYMHQCIDSILNQTYKNIEIILVDDGSPDDCGKICDEYRSKDQRIVVIHKENGGLSDARNAGISAATSEWVTFVDGDDWIELDFFEDFINRVKGKKEHADIYFYSGYRNYSNKEEIKVPHFKNETLFRSIEELEDLQMRCFTTHIKKGGNVKGITISSGCMKIFRTDFLKSNNLFFPIVPYDEDSLFYLEFLEKASLVQYISKAVYHYRYTEGSIVNRYRPNAIVEQKIYLDYIFDFIKKYNKSQIFINNAYMRVMTSMLLLIKHYFFHSENPESFFNRQKECTLCFRQEPYSTALRKICIKELRGNARIKLILLRLHMYSFIEYGRKIVSG